MFYLALFKPFRYFLFFYIQISWTRNTQNIWESYLDFLASMMKSTKHIWNLTQLPKVFIPNTIRSMLILWHIKWVSCALAYFDPKKLKIKSQNYGQFSHFYVNQHFISDATMYNLFFYFFCSWKWLKKVLSPI